MYEYVISNTVNYNFIFIVFVSFLILFSFCSFLFSRQINFMFRMVFDTHHFFYYSGNKKKNILLFLIPLIIIFTVCISFITFHEVSYQNHFIKEVVKCFSFISIIFTLKALLILYLTNIFNRNFQRNLIIYNCFIHEAALSILLFPFAFILYYINEYFIIYPIIGILVLIFYSYKYYKLYKLCFYKINLFYSSIFLYLCCLEIIPILYFLKIFI